MSEFWIGNVRFGLRYFIGGLVLSGMTGWYDTPEDKTDYTARSSGDGSYAPASARRGNRVLDLDLGFSCQTRAAAVALYTRLNAMHRTRQTIRLVDEDDTTCTGTVTFSFPKVWSLAGSFSATVTCVDPVRVSSVLQDLFLQAAAAGSTGLEFGTGLEWPVSFGGEGLDGSNTGVLTNRGNEAAWPAFTTVGTFPGGFRVEAAGQVLEWPNSVSASAPVTLDAKNRRALVLGVDRTADLSRRSWVSVPAADQDTGAVGRLPVVLIPLELATGTVRATVRDTWM
jgi:hypothetical protein